MDNVTQIKNGDAAKNEKLAEGSTKKGRLATWWDGLSPSVQDILAIGAAATGFVIACVAAGSVAESINAASTRKTLNTDGFKHLVDRGLLDPVPPPKTLEEAAARMVENSPRMLPFEITEV